ncbi:MAG: sigma 54-interacting transcriptional regulator, partial [bacterium]
PRRSQPFMTIHCGTTPEHALESELFGHAKGVMPGAVRAQRGVFEQACGGTLFIEEISLMPTALQAKLVSAIQEEEVRPVGDSKPVAIDVHVIAATSVDLEGAIADGSFREDLYYRLNVMQVQVPALRDRPEDIPLLCDHFLAHYSASLGKQVRRISNDALDRLIGYSWPGNVRELQNVIERAVIVTEDERVAISHLPREIVEASSTGASTDSKTFAMRRARRLFEIELITRALRETNGNRTHAAKLLEISH